MTKQYIVIFLLITVISSLALAISPENRQRKECLNRTLTKLLKYPLNSTYCDHMNLCKVPCNKNLTPPTDLEVFDKLNPKFGSSMPSDKCLRPITFLRTTNSKSCDKIADCPNAKCVGKTKRDVNSDKAGSVAFEAFACISSTLLLAAVEIGTRGLATPVLVTPATMLAGKCGGITAVKTVIDVVGGIFDWW